jgi:protein-tyrosine phosphatase
MAEGIMKKMLIERGVKDVSVLSMGVYARSGNKPTKLTLVVCKENGINIENHCSSPLVPQELKESDYIFVMELAQYEYLSTFFPQVSDRIYMLGAWPQRVDKKANIPDPIGKSLEVYRKAFLKIEECIERVIKDIL